MFDTLKGNRIINEIIKQFPNKKFNTVSRQAFSKENGIDRLYQLCISSSFPVLIMLKNR